MAGSAAASSRAPSRDRRTDSVPGVSAARDLDVVVFGATGFVGRLTAEYLVTHAPGGVRIGLGGRSADKLERLKAELGRDDLDVLVADSSDRGALERIARRTR